MSGMSEKLSIVNEVAHPGSPGTYRRISATMDLLIEETTQVKLRHQESEKATSNSSSKQGQPNAKNAIKHPALKESNSHSHLSKLNILSHDKLRRAFSAGTETKG